MPVFEVTDVGVYFHMVVETEAQVSVFTVNKINRLNGKITGTQLPVHLLLFLLALLKCFRSHHTWVGYNRTEIAVVPHFSTTKVCSSAQSQRQSGGR